MARQGLMDDAGYDFLEPTDCANFESCTEEAVKQGWNEAIDYVIDRYLFWKSEYGNEIAFEDYLETLKK